MFRRSQSARGANLTGKPAQQLAKEYRGRLPWPLILLAELAASVWRTVGRFYVAALILLACIAAAPILSHYAHTGELPEKFEVSE